VAGGAGKVTFAPRALATVHGLSNGIPRLINLICDRALLAGYVRGTRVIEAEMVRQAAAETVGVGKKGFDLHHYAAGVVVLLVLAGFCLLATTLVVLLVSQNAHGNEEINQLAVGRTLLFLLPADERVLRFAMPAITIAASLMNFPARSESMSRA
jgi:hypothetical protein